MDPRFTTAAAPRFVYRPGAFRNLRTPGAAPMATRSGELMGQSTTTWLAVGAVVVVGAVLLTKKRRRK